MTLCPLDIQVALHYWTTPGRYAAHEPEHSNSPAVQRSKKRFLNAGLFAEDEASGDVVCIRESMRPWVDALCAMPFPVKRWIMP